jgi:hypothetical protein
MPTLRLASTLLSFATRVTAVIRRYWEDEFDYWQAMGDVWEQQN